jgi:hypothetical protein
LAEAIKKALPNTIVGVAGLITEAEQAEEIVSKGRADVVCLARAVLKDKNFPLRAAETLGVAIKPPNQYERAWPKVGDVSVFISGSHTQQLSSDAHSCQAWRVGSREDQRARQPLRRPIFRPSMSKLQCTRDIGNGVLRTVVIDCRTIYGMLLPLRFDHHSPHLRPL